MSGDPRLYITSVFPILGPPSSHQGSFVVIAFVGPNIVPTREGRILEFTEWECHDRNRVLHPWLKGAMKMLCSLVWITVYRFCHFDLGRGEHLRIRYPAGTQLGSENRILCSENGYEFIEAGPTYQPKNRRVPKNAYQKAGSPKEEFAGLKLSHLHRVGKLVLRILATGEFIAGRNKNLSRPLWAKFCPGIENEQKNCSKKWDKQRLF